MSDYTIITDSATDMPGWVIEKYDLKVIPTPVVIDGKDYFDGTTIKPDRFFDILRSGASVTTYHINQFMFTENFKPYAQRGESVIYFCFSTGIAGTFNAATLAKNDLLDEFPDFDLTIVDSKCASIGFGMCVYMALLMKEKGASKEEVLEAARFHFDHCEHIVTVETLEYLYKGGRISKVSEFAGEILDIKPLIEVTDDGKLEVFEKVRGRKKSLKRAVEVVGERGVNLSEQIVGIVNADCADVAAQVKESLSQSYGITKFIDATLGCAIGAHTGPGLIGITFLNEQSPYKKYFE